MANQQKEIFELRNKYNKTIKIIKSFFWVQSYMKLIMSNPDTWSKLTETRSEALRLLSEINEVIRNTKNKALNIIWETTTQEENLSPFPQINQAEKIQAWKEKQKKAA